MRAACCAACCNTAAAASSRQLRVASLRVALTRRRAALPSPSTPSLPYRSVNDANVATVRRRWVAAGRPTKPDWKAMFKGLF